MITSDKTSQRTAMVFAAGLGTRLKPLTDSIPKALVPYRGTPLIEEVIMKLRSFGFDRIVINVHHFASMIEDFIASHHGFGAEILFSDETDLLRDTGGGIKHAAAILGRAPFLVHNVDIISNIDLDWFYGKHIVSDGAVATLLVSERDTSRYFLFDEKMVLVGWMNIATGEVKSPFEEIRREKCEILSSKFKMLAFGGMHVISPDIFPLMESWPEKFSIVDFYLSIADRFKICGCKAPDGTNIVDVGKLSQLL